VARAPEPGAAAPATRLAVKVVPGSSRDCIAGWLGESLRVRVSAPPERGRANAAVEQLIAGALGLARASVRVVAGGTSPRKIVEVSGIAPDELQRRLVAATTIAVGATARVVAAKEGR
jgi:uncharacterized protein YggU (UPF0235/DUF167 family)